VSGNSPALFLDFDGTVTEEDTLVLLLDRFGRALPDGRDWRAIEFDESLPENVKLQAELDLLEVGLDEALAWLDGVARLRAGFDRFLDWTEGRGLRPTILSGGLEPIIARLLGPRAARVELRANGLEIENGRWIVQAAPSPRIRNQCNHCKTWHLRQAGDRPLVYIGDGATDFCPARAADRVFARSSLAAQLAAEGRRFTPFTTFVDVIEDLERGGL
jgi:2,3-diketo-5-methylthio-1-phosphopentane phosphatase